MTSAARLEAICAHLTLRAHGAAAANNIAVIIGGQTVGTASQAVAAHLAANRAMFDLGHSQLRMRDDSMNAAERSAILKLLAMDLRDAGLINGWRDELLDLRASPQAAPLAQLERAACRALGITTHAVHLNAFADNGDLVIAQRSPSKAIDPGLWDNLVGGMVPSGESLDEALEREAWEEAGLAIDRIEITRGRSFHVSRSVPEGFQSEIVHVYDCMLAADAALKNQDGEVANIERRSVAQVLDAIEREEFTLEAALATVEALTRRGAYEVHCKVFY